MEIPADSDKNPISSLLCSPPQDPQKIILNQQIPHPYSTEDMMPSLLNNLSNNRKQVLPVQNPR